MAGNAAWVVPAYHAKMPRKSTKLKSLQPVDPDWYLPQWMSTLGVSQAKLAKKCDWAESTMHGIYHGRTKYYRDILNLLAKNLNIQPYELLMPPELAMAFRQFQSSAQQITTLVHSSETPPVPTVIDRLADETEEDRKERKARTGTHD